VRGYLVVSEPTKREIFETAGDANKKSINGSLCIRSILFLLLRRGSAAARLLGLRVRIPRRAWMFVCCECCVCCQVEDSATGRSLVQRSPTDCGASLRVISEPQE
jgi:hypothetical protein